MTGVQASQCWAAAAAAGAQVQSLQWQLVALAARHVGLPVPQNPLAKPRLIWVPECGARGALWKTLMGGELTTTGNNNIRRISGPCAMRVLVLTKYEHDH
jgi:hypothetical protein